LPISKDESHLLPADACQSLRPCCAYRLSLFSVDSDAQALRSRFHTPAARQLPSTAAARGGKHFPSSSSHILSQEEGSRFTRLPSADCGFSSPAKAAAAAAAVTAALDSHFKLRKRFLFAWKTTAGLVPAAMLSSSSGKGCCLPHWPDCAWVEAACKIYFCVWKQSLPAVSQAQSGLF